MDPKKAAAEWFHSTVFKDEAIQPRAPGRAERIPSLLRAARSLESGVHQSWQSQEALFMKQAKLLVNYEDDYDYHGSVTCYYPTYQALTDQQLRGYFTWRTRLRRGDIRETSLSFAFLYIYELINQIGVADPMDGYWKLERFRDAYGEIDGRILSYLRRWLPDYVVYYGLDGSLLADTPQVILDRCVTVLEHIQEQDAADIVDAVRRLSPKWLGRSRFYGAYQADMDSVIVRVLRRVSAHYAARCKRTMVEQYFGTCGRRPVRMFDSAVFCNPLKRRDYEYTVGEQRVYHCKNGLWYVWARASSPGSSGELDALLKTVDSVMRQAYDYRPPVKPGMGTKWISQIIQEEAQGLLAEKRAAEENKVTIDYAQLTRIRQDAATTREKLIVDEETDPPEPPAPQAPEPEPAQLTLAAQPDSAGACPLDPAEYRLLQCLLYGGDTGWVQAEGHLLSVLVDGINEKLYDAFLDCVLDDTPRPVEDYTDDLKEMVRP